MEYSSLVRDPPRPPPPCILHSACVHMKHLATKAKLNRFTVIIMETNALALRQENTVAAPGAGNDPAAVEISLKREAARKGALIEAHEAEFTIGDTKYKAKAEVGVLIDEEHQEELKLEATDQGVSVSHKISRKVAVQRFAIFHLYEVIEADQSNKEVTPTESERCTDICCQGFTCSCTNPFKKNNQENSKRLIAKKELMTDSLRRGRAKGWNLYNDVVFPLFRDSVRDVWVVLQFITVLIGLGLNIALTVNIDKNRIFNYLHLALVILSSLLASLDVIRALRQCRSCKMCHKACRREYPIGEDPDDGDHDDEEQVHSCKGKCCKCFKTTTDVVRVFVVEMLLYPLLICSIFGVITGKNYEGKQVTDRLNFALFILSCISLFLYVYIARILIVIGMIRSVQEARTPGEKAKESDDPYVGSSALRYQIIFFFHVVLQMIAQIMMFVAIGAKIQYDNRHLFYPYSFDESIHVSGHLWYMIVAAYVTPAMGFLMFFVVTYYWTQEFPVGLLLDMVNILKMTGHGPDTFLYKKNRECKSSADILKVFNNFVNLKTLRKDFEKLRDKHVCDKLFYPYTAPMIVIVCIIYVATQVAFVTCAAVTIDEMGTLTTQILDGGGWVFYYIAAVVVGGIANAYAFAIVAFWIGVVVFILLGIATFIYYCPCIFCFWLVIQQN